MVCEIFFFLAEHLGVISVQEILKEEEEGVGLSVGSDGCSCAFVAETSRCPFCGGAVDSQPYIQAAAKGYWLRSGEVCRIDSLVIK